MTVVLLLGAVALSAFLIVDFFRNGGKYSLERAHYPEPAGRFEYARQLLDSNEVIVELVSCDKNYTSHYDVRFFVASAGQASEVVLYSSVTWGDMTEYVKQDYEACAVVLALDLKNPEEEIRSGSIEGSGARYVRSPHVWDDPTKGGGK